MLGINENIECIKKIVLKEDCVFSSLEANSNKNIQDLTLIIPSHNRHDCLEQSIKYYRLIGIKCVYVDSSDTKYETNLLDENIVYIHLPGYSFVEKMIYILKKIETTYVCTCADDDFLIFKEIANGYTFLQKNTDYVLYYGNNWSFIKEDQSFKLNKNNIKEKNIVGNKRKRVNQFFREYQNVLWSLSKREVLLKGYQILSETNFSNHNFYEITLGANFTFYGNVYISSNLWIIRESNQKSWGSQHASLITSRRDNIFKEDYNKFIKASNEYLSVNYGKYAFRSYFMHGYKRIVYSKFLFRALKTLIKKLTRN